jgi:DNA-binding response OmpR family regulator
MATTHTPPSMPLREESVQQDTAPGRPIADPFTVNATSAPAPRQPAAPALRVSSAFADVLLYVPALLESPGVGQIAPLLREIVQRALGVIPFQVAPFDLGDLLMNILPQWKMVAPRHTLELALPGDIPPVYADGEWAARALSLLIDYAIGATPQGGAVRVSVRPEADGVAARVRHFGVTPDQEELEHVLAPCVAVQGATSRGAKGLELSLARVILEAHGGRLWAEPPATGEGLALATWWPIHEMAPSSPGEAETAESVQRPGGGADLSRAERGFSSGRAPVFDRERPVTLLIEEDARMARYLKANLDAAGFATSVARGPEDAARAVDLYAPDLLIVDGGLPGMSDLTLLRDLLARGGCPVIILGRAHNPLASARALDAGASDWIARPFNTEELLARIRAVLRSRRESEFTRREVAIGDLTFDVGERSVRRDGKLIPLSKTELKLLRALAQRPGAVLSHEALLERVWGPGYHDATDFLWVYVRRLRKKIEADPSAPRYVLTVPGIGYRLAHHEEITNS